jgi:hypothetical protein
MNFVQLLLNPRRRRLERGWQTLHRAMWHLFRHDQDSLRPYFQRRGDLAAARLLQACMKAVLAEIRQ